MPPFGPRKTGIELRSVVLLVPAGDTYTTAATTMAAGLQRSGCVSVRTVVANEVPVTTAGDTLIALGNCADNALFRQLYYHARDLTDLAWPGNGGWAIRSLDNATPDGADAVLVSVSTSADATAAAAALCNILDAHGPSLPPLHRVAPGEWQQLYLEQIHELLPTPDTSLDVPGGGSGDWDYMMAIGKLGVLAVRTGDSKLILRFTAELLRFLRVRFREREMEDAMQIHGFLRNLLRPFAMLEQHPAISDALRLELLQGLLELYRSTEGAANPRLLDDAGFRRVRQNHGTRTAVDVYDGGLYFWRQHGLTEARDWMQLAARFFAPQMESSKPVCDSWGHQWTASMYTTAEYALLCDNHDYFRSAPFTDAVDRALMAHSHLENGPALYLQMAAAVTGNGAYLALSPRHDLVQQTLGLLGADEFARSWLVGVPPGRPGELTGVRVAPVAELFYDSIASYEAYAPAGVYRQDVPLAGTFDKISYRSGWGQQDAYLLLDGISGGSHSYQDGNCIVRLDTHGKAWFGGPQYGSWTTGSVREQNGISVSCDGEGPGCESRFARLQQAETIDGVGLIRTQMDLPATASWFRQIVIHPQGWMLVCDEIVAARAGEFTVQGQWNLLGEVSDADDGGSVRSTQDSVQLTLLQAGASSTWLAPVCAAGAQVSTRWNLRQSQALKAGESVLQVTMWRWAQTTAAATPTLALQDRTLLVAVPGYERVTLQFDPRSDAAAVAGDVIQLVAVGERPKGKRPLRQITGESLTPVWRCELASPTDRAASIQVIKTAGDTCFLGTATGDTHRLDATGGLAAPILAAEGITALLPLPDAGLLTGGDDGTLCRYDSAGALLWRQQILWQPMGWDNWTRGHCAILDVAVGELGGRLRIIVGCADRHVYAFDLHGSLLWRAPCQWGPAAHVAIAAIGDDGQNLILVGMERPAIHACCLLYDAQGTCLRALQRPDVACWSIPSWLTGLAATDIDADGAVEVIVGMDTNHRQLIVYGASGTILWDADLGSTVSCMVVEHDRIYAGTEGGWLHTFAPQGQRLARVNVHRPVRALAPVTADRNLVALDDGTIVVASPPGATAAGTLGVTGRARFWPGHGLLVSPEGGGSVALYR
ncbi:MAG: hypothetical protein O2782_08870 [bacterium]|nr:hypothetical protein [bacterium]